MNPRKVGEGKRKIEKKGICTVSKGDILFEFFCLCPSENCRSTMNAIPIQKHNYDLYTVLYHNNENKN